MKRTVAFTFLDFVWGTFFAEEAAVATLAAVVADLLVPACAFSSTFLAFIQNGAVTTVGATEAIPTPDSGLVGLFPVCHFRGEDLFATLATAVHFRIGHCSQFDYAND